MSGAPPIIDVSLVERLIRQQFPQWAGLHVTPVVHDGWDNRTFRLGDSLSVRLPSAEGYVLQIEKEHRWLPQLAPALPLPIPTPVALGAPGCGYPFPWSVYRWIDGDVAAGSPIGDLDGFADDLADFLTALQRVDASDGPGPGRHNFYRGGPLAVYDAEARRSIRAIGDAIDGRAALAVMDRALVTGWTHDPVWFHGDVSVGNLLLTDGRLSAVIDFGTSGVGDPACDLVIAWTLFDGDSRRAFREGMQLDTATWERARGWALWKALLIVAGSIDARSPSKESAASRRVIDEVLAEHAATAG